MAGNAEDIALDPRRSPYAYGQPWFELDELVFDTRSGLLLGHGGRSSMVRACHLDSRFNLVVIPQGRQRIL